MSGEWKAPRGLVQAVDAALAAGRAFIVNHGTDSGDSPFVSLTVKWPLHEVRLTWHTRDTGTYRLFSAMAKTDARNWHDVTMAKAIQVIAGPGTKRTTLDLFSAAAGTQVEATE